MKKLLVCSLILVGAYSSAHAESRCGMPQGSPCRDFYSRFDAFKRLQENENDINDAQGNLALVETVQKRLNLNLEYVVDNFIYIQQSVGGSGQTSTARQAFNLIVNEVYGQNQLHDLADKLIDLVRAENDINDAQGNFSLVANYVRSGQISFQSGTRLFLSVLNLEGGSGQTSSARDTFNKLMGQKNKFQLKDLFNSYQSLLRSENDRNDAIGNFDIVLLAAERCGSLEQATTDFLQVLNQVGGSGQTSKAREVFRNLYGI